MHSKRLTSESISVWQLHLVLNMCHRLILEMPSANCSFSHQALCKEITTRIAGNLVRHLTSREFGGRGKTVILQNLHRKWKVSVAIEHFQKCWPMARPPKPSDFYGPESHMPMELCGMSRCKCGIMPWRKSGKRGARRGGRRGAHLNFLLLLYWDT